MNRNDPICLSETEIIEIRRRIQSLRHDKQILNALIKDDVFPLLECECKVLYYPIDDLSLWAFHQKVDRLDGTSTGFVFINTAQPYEKQVFAAAHELAHVWGVADNTQELIMEDASGEPAFRRMNGSEPSSHTEAVANRFAAEFLLDESIVQQLYVGMQTGKNHVDEFSRLLALILGLMDACIVPYKMTVLRLHELNLINNVQKESLLLHSYTGMESPIIQMQNRLGLCKRNNEKTRMKKFADFIDLVVHDYSEEKLTFPKMKQLLALFDLSPEAVGITSEKEPYSAEELEAMLDAEQAEDSSVIPIVVRNNFEGATSSY